jgi:hypothetical protein
MAENYDLFNNPMVEAAKRNMTKEQIEEYKRVGEYMYKHTNFNAVDVGSGIKEPTNEELAKYAECALRSGGDPKDLTDGEIVALIQKYGEKWYENFCLQKDDIRLPLVVPCSGPDEEVVGHAAGLSRQERRLTERRKKKNKC